MMLTALDWLILAIILGSMAVALFRGLAAELLSLCSWLLAFWVARTWLAVTTACIAWGSGRCTPSVSRKGVLYCSAGCIRSPISEPICHSAKRSGKDLIE